MKQMNRGKLYKLCEDYIRISNVKYEIFGEELDFVERIEEELEKIEEKIKKTVNEEDEIHLQDKQ